MPLALWSSVGAILPSLLPETMFGDKWLSQLGEGCQEHLVGKKLGMLLNILQCTGQPSTENCHALNVNNAQVKKP